MIKVWADHAWDDYLYWQVRDRKTLKRINQLLKDIDRNGHTGLGKPEPLKHDKQGYWSRRPSTARTTTIKRQRDRKKRQLEALV